VKGSALPALNGRSGLLASALFALLLAGCQFVWSMKQEFVSVPPRDNPIAAAFASPTEYSDISPTAGKALRRWKSQAPSVAGDCDIRPEPGCKYTIVLMLVTGSPPGAGSCLNVEFTVVTNANDEMGARFQVVPVGQPMFRC
jgi:hypothetical protein